MGYSVARCPLNHYMDNTIHFGNCQPCPDGFECQGYAMVDAPETTLNVECGQGYYASVLDLFCMVCPRGHYCPNAANAAPLHCTGGTYADEGKASCDPCPDNYYAKMGSAYCSPVPAGFQIVNADTDQEDIEVCAQGTYSSWGMETCETCLDGYLCPEGSTEGNAWHNICPKGSYCIGGVQTKCPAGYYGTHEGAKSETFGCAECPPGYNCQPGTADFELVPCPQGGYCPRGSAVIYCPAGTFNDNLYGRSLGDCRTCPAGQ